jgi:hypothetical protein
MSFNSPEVADRGIDCVDALNALIALAIMARAVHWVVDVVVHISSGGMWPVAIMRLRRLAL